MTAHVHAQSEEIDATSQPKISPAFQGPGFQGPDRRAHVRHAVDCPVEVVPLTGATRIAGRLVDLSLGGCRLETPERVMVTIQMRVELQFQVRGIAFRLIGVCQGTRGGNLYAVRFQNISDRKRAELAEVLAEVAHQNALKAAAAAQAAAAPPAPLPAPLPAELPAPLPQAAPASQATPPSAQVASPAPIAAPSLPAAKALAHPATEHAAEAAVPSRAPRISAADRRTNSRHSVDTNAKLLLVKTGISMPSRILNLSLSGCRLRTEERFNVGIYVRLETEFYLHGLPFRLGGVSQAILDKYTIGIRFLDVSERKREQLTELMAEIAALEAADAAAGTARIVPAPGQVSGT